MLEHEFVGFCIMINSEVTEAIKVLKQGGIVIFPTDTAFGIGCRMDLESSVRKLFTVRRRPASQAAPVLVGSQKMALAYLLHPIPNNVRQLMDKYWPGALTIVYSCNISLVPSYVRGNGINLGVRMPDHRTALQLIEGVGVPILGPSANFHGHKTPFDFSDLDKNLIKLADFVVTGNCRKKNVSTVIDCSVNPPKIIRQGEVIIKTQYEK